MSKICTKCKEEKSLSEFTRRSKSKDGLDYRCKVCIAKYHHDHYRANSERILERHKDWARENPEKRKEGQQRWLKEYRFTRALVSSRDAAKRQDHVPCNITAEELKATFTGKCEVCGIPEIECSRKLSMDHDHETGEFRGWLCTLCNVALGALKDSPAIIRSLVEYIEQAGRKEYGSQETSENFLSSGRIGP